MCFIKLNDQSNNELISDAICIDDGMFPLEGNESWWDIDVVCEELKIEDADSAVLELDPDQKSVIFLGKDQDGRTYRGKDKVLLTNRSGLFYLILRSQTPFGKRIRRWITDEVLNELCFGDGFMWNVWNEHIVKTIYQSLNVEVVTEIPKNLGT
jgi:hypothetical protein